jgi:hypothetical protein
MKDYAAAADAFVSDFVERHIKTRVLDGRPDRILVKTLTIEIAEFLRSQCENEKPVASKGARRG